MNGINPILLLIAIMLDLFGFVCLIISLTLNPLIGETLAKIPDFLGLFLIGGFQLYSYRRAHFQKAKTIRKKAARKKGFKFFATFFGELLPFVGALPLWTLYVVSTGKEAERQRAPATA